MEIGFAGNDNSNGVLLALEILIITGQEVSYSAHTHKIDKVHDKSHPLHRCH